MNDIPQENALPIIRHDSNDKPLDSDAELAREIYTDWKSVRDDRQDWIEEVIMDEKFVNGDQWTSEERTELNAKCMPDYTTNLIFPAVQSAISHILANSPSFIFIHPVSKDVTHLNDLLFHIFRKSQFKMVSKKAIASAMIKSMGGVYIYEDTNANDGLGEVKIILANIRNIYVPKHCKLWDWSDATHIYYSWLTTKDVFMQEYNLSPDDVENCIIGYDEGYLDDVNVRPSLRSNTKKIGEDNSRLIKEDKRKRYIRLIVRFRKIYTPTRTLFDKRSGNKYVLERTEGDKETIQQNEQQIPKWALTEEAQAILKTSLNSTTNFLLKESKKVKIEAIVTAGQKYVLDQKILDLSFYPIVPIYYWDNESPFPYSFVHFVEQQQKIYNLADSAMLYNAQAGSFARQAGPKGFMGRTAQEKEEYQRNMNMPNGFAEYHTDPALPDGGRPTLIPPQPLNNTFPSIKQEASYRIQYISGEFGIRQGDPSQSPNTFRGMAALLEHAKDRTKEFGDNIDNWFERIGTIVYELSKSVYTYPMQINTPINDGQEYKSTTINQVRIEDDRQVIDNGVFNSQAEIAVKPGSYAPVYRYIILSALELMLQQGYPVADMMLDYIDMPDDKKQILKERLAAQNDVQAIMQMLNQAKKDLEKTQSDNIELLKQIDILTAKTSVAKAEGKMLGDIEAAKRETKAEIKEQNKSKE